MKSILITTDFSDHSEYTLRYVLDLVRHTKTVVRILLLNTYMVDLQTDPQRLVQLNDELKSKSKQSLEVQKREALQWIRNPNIAIETTSHMGSLANVITNLIKKEKIDLVAMGKDNGQQIEKMTNLLKEYDCSLLVTNYPKA